MTLELTDSERQLLLDTLRSRLGELREEIHHSMTSKYTDELKQREKDFKALIEKLEADASS